MEAQSITRIDSGGADRSGRRQSAYELLVQYRGVLAVYMAALLFDTVSTIHFMVREGIYLELHPLVRYSSYVYGPVAGPFLFAFLFKLLAGLLLLFTLKHYAHYLLKAAIVTSLLAGTYNFFQFLPTL